jgi:TIGR03009 family protein
MLQARMMRPLKLEHDWLNNFCLNRRILILATAVVWLSTSSATAQPIAPGGVVPAQAFAQPPVPQVPFQLSPQDDAALEVVLRAWENNSSQITTYSCDFALMEYDSKGNFSNNPRPDNLKRQSQGVIRFAKPDKGLYNITKVDFPPADKGQTQEAGDYWVCDGKAIYTKDYVKKTVVEYRLPPELQGKAISDGPLPFVFGVQAAKLRQRYWMRITTPPGVRGQIWLEAYPKHHQDAQNFRKIDVILTDNDLTPTAVQIYLPNDESHRQPPMKVTNVYVFSNIKKNAVFNRIQDFLNDFVGPPTPFGWKRDVQDNGSSEPQVAGPTELPAAGQQLQPGPMAPGGQVPGGPSSRTGERPLQLPAKR